MNLPPWIQNLWRKLLTRLGWNDCPVCNAFVRLKWVQDVVHFEDEPPMFYHYECHRLGG